MGSGGLKLGDYLDRIVWGGCSDEAGFGSGKEGKVRGLNGFANCVGVITTVGFWGWFFTKGL